MELQAIFLNIQIHFIVVILVCLDDVQHQNHMFSALTYFFDHSIYFARLHHVNPLCKHQYAFLQMKEAPNQKVQEKKPLLKFKNTKKNMCLERIWRKKCFRACRHRPLLIRVMRKHDLTNILTILTFFFFLTIFNNFNNFDNFRQF